MKLKSAAVLSSLSVICWPRHVRSLSFERCCVLLPPPPCVKRLTLAHMPPGGFPSILMRVVQRNAMLWLFCVGWPGSDLSCSRPPVLLQFKMMLLLIHCTGWYVSGYSLDGQMLSVVLWEKFNGISDTRLCERPRLYFLNSSFMVEASCEIAEVAVSLLFPMA